MVRKGRGRVQSGTTTQCEGARRLQASWLSVHHLLQCHLLCGVSTRCGGSSPGCFSLTPVAAGVAVRPELGLGTRTGSLGTRCFLAPAAAREGPSEAQGTSRASVEFTYSDF